MVLCKNGGRDSVRRQLQCLEHGNNFGVWGMALQQIVAVTSLDHGTIKYDDWSDFDFLIKETIYIFVESLSTEPQS